MLYSWPSSSTVIPFFNSPVVIISTPEASRFARAGQDTRRAILQDHQIFDTDAAPARLAGADRAIAAPGVRQRRVRSARPDRMQGRSVCAPFAHPLLDGPADVALGDPGPEQLARHEVERIVRQADRVLDERELGR